MQKRFGTIRVKKSRRFVGVGLIILLLTFGGIGWLVFNSVQNAKALTEVANLDPNATVMITIPSGFNTTQVGALLKEKQVIVNDGAFVSYVKSQDLGSKILAGNYTLKPSRTIPQLVEVLVGQEKDLVILTIPEGFSTRQIEDLLKKKQIITGDEFRKCIQECAFKYPFVKAAPRKTLEGYLFPNTYTVDRMNFRMDEFVAELLGEFNDQVQAFSGQLKASKRTLDQVIIMASMVEKEAISDEERPIVAGILWKRLDAGWYLGVDATTRYYKDDWETKLTNSDLKNDNPYNTRINKGLPPTPICNPGIESIKAALLPEDSSYWYYLHDKNKQIHYAKTQEEHDLNRVRYLQ